MRVKPIVKAVLYALAVQRHGPQAWKWGLWEVKCGLVVMADESAAWLVGSRT